MKGLFLDDVRKVSSITDVAYPKDVEWTIVKSYREFMLAIDEQKDFEVFSFDHYLEEGQRLTGLDVLKDFLCNIEYEGYPCPKFHNVFFHSSDIEKRKEGKNIWMKFFNNDL